MTDQNLAFRAVNQSIGELVDLLSRAMLTWPSSTGRAIRNARDWAAITLLDERYQQPSKRAQLPGWLGSGVENPQTFGALMKSLSGFIRTRKIADTS